MKLKSSSLWLSLAGCAMMGPMASSANDKIAPSSEQKHPHIVFIVVDDLGWMDVQVLPDEIYGPYSTPNIAALAKQGLVFTDAYSASPVCSPTRASLLTGKSPTALGMTSFVQGNPEGYRRNRYPDNPVILGAESIDRLPLDEITFAELLKEDGYSTGFFGKWHLAGAGSMVNRELKGMIAADYHPEHQGFDVNIGGCAFGQPLSFFSPYRNATIPDGPDGEYLTDRLTEEAMSFMKENYASGPVLVYLNYYAVHRPHQARPDLLKPEKYGEMANYAAMIAAVDENLGRIMTFLEDNGLKENTLVLFTSDNGSLEGNDPLRGTKGSSWEGGIRVPFIARFPGVIAPGSVSHEPVISYDFLPTLLSAVGSSQTLPEGVEGVCMMPLFTGEGTFERKEPLHWHFPHYHYDGMTSAIRDQNFKLIYAYETQQFFMFDIFEDIGEKQDISGLFPEKAGNLKNRLFSLLESLDARMPIPVE